MRTTIFWQKKGRVRMLSKEGNWKRRQPNVFCALAAAPLGGNQTHHRCGLIGRRQGASSCGALLGVVQVDGAVGRSVDDAAAPKLNHATEQHAYL